jgi:Amidohydrolase
MQPGCRSCSAGAGTSSISTPSSAGPRCEIPSRCSTIAFEGDEESVYRIWDHYENVGLWSSDYPHHDAEDAWEALELMERHKVPGAVQRKLLGENARRLYGIEPITAVTERVEQYEPARLPW